MKPKSAASDNSIIVKRNVVSTFALMHDIHSFPIVLNSD